MTTLGKGGAPPAINRVIGTGHDGNLITALERIPELMRAGMYLEGAAEASGVKKNTVYTWLRHGANAFNRRYTAEQMGRECVLTEHELDCIRFNDLVTKASADYELECNLILGQLMRGGMKTVKTTVKRGPRKPNGDPGDIIEESTVTDVLPPNSVVLMWRMTRRWPDRYGHKIEVTDGKHGPELGEADVAEQLINSIEEFLGSNQDDVDTY
jgi:hypothetical protein